MAGTFWKWLIPGAITVLAGTALAVTQTDAGLSTDLATRSSAALDPAKFGWAHVTVDGRDATISGTATSRAAIDNAVAKIATVYGVRSVSSAVVLAEVASPFPFTASVKNGATSLAGAYPDEAIHVALLAEVGKASDSMRLGSGAPASYEAGAKFALTALTD